MNKRQAKKKRKFREDQEYYMFMCGMLPLNLSGSRRVKRWLKIELNNIKKIELNNIKKENKIWED